MRTGAGVIRTAGAEGRAIGVVNRVTPGKGAARDYSDASDLIAKFGIRSAGVYVCERAAYRKTMSEGKGVTQLPVKEGKAASDEIIALWSELTETPPIALMPTMMIEEEPSS